MSEIKVSVTLVKETDFGNHGGMMRSAHELIPGETVERLVSRLLGEGGQNYWGKPHDWVELRLVDAAPENGEVPF